MDAERRRAHERARVVGRLLRHAASVLQHALCEQSALGRADHAVESGGRIGESLSNLPRWQSLPGTGQNLSGQFLPIGRRLRQRATQHQTDLFAAMEPERAATGW